MRDPVDTKMGEVDQKNLHNIAIKTTPGLLYAGVGTCALLEVICIAAITFARKNEIFVALNPLESRIAVQVVFLVIALLTLFAMILCLPRWTETIVLTPKNIILKRAFSDKREYQYMEYKYSYLLSIDGVLCDCIHDASYLVISKTPVAKDELKKYSKILCSVDRIKVSISKKNQGLLIQLLDSKLRCRKR